MINDLLGHTILYVIVYEIQSYTKEKKKSYALGNSVRSLEL